MNAIQPLVDGTRLIFSSADGVVHRVPLASVVLIGERTDVGGAYFEDYWLVVALHNDVIWEFGSEDPSFTQLYSSLGTALTGSPFLPGLCNQSGVASRILWPIEHLDAPLIEQTPTPASHHSWSLVARKLLADHGYAT